MRRDVSVVFIGRVSQVEERLSTLEMFSEFEEGITGIEVFSHLIVLYWFDKRDNWENRRVLSVVPPRHKGAPKIGVYGYRSPSRPNPIGHSVVELVKRTRNSLVVEGLDAFVGSSLIDIKPYIPRADAHPNARVPDWVASRS